jgi:hypothetical protein
VQYSKYRSVCARSTHCEEKWGALSKCWAKVLERSIKLASDTVGRPSNADRIPQTLCCRALCTDVSNFISNVRGVYQSSLERPRRKVLNVSIGEGGFEGGGLDIGSGAQGDMSASRSCS